ncbi:MAG: hypothetical protein IPL87_01040 [Candidatus Moraniibacteriota bacterium]|nr:MAG: hypothetical protein IPL87_01040 [Candidatus Moranbacteria bacterium]
MNESESKLSPHEEKENMDRGETWKDSPSSSERYEEIRVRTFPMLPSELKRMRKDERKIPTKENWKMAKRETEKVCRKRTPKGHSPEQIAGRLKTSPPKNLSSCTDTSISYESIYDYIYRGEGRVGGWYNICDENRSGDDQSSLENREKRRFRIEYPFTKDPRSLPSVHLGDWETDSVIFSKQKSVLSVQYERKMKLCRLKKVPNKTAVESERAIQGHFSRLPQQLRRRFER